MAPTNNAQTPPSSTDPQLMILVCNPTHAPSSKYSIGLH